MKKVAYYCDTCREATIVVDHSDKALPPKIKCGATGGCHVGTSTLSAQVLPPNIVASHKTFLPNEDEINRAEPAMKAHGLAGGVFIRSKRE